MAGLLLFQFGCGSKTESTELTRNGEEVLLSGSGLYKRWNCGACHGEYGGGSSTGPPLKNLSTHWKRKRLADYLANPNEFNMRLDSLAKRYRPVAMPAFQEMSEEERGDLAAYILTFD